MVRDPDRYTPMAGVPEFAAAGVDRVQGGTFPARIWGTFMDAIGLERVGLDADWERPGLPPRPPARLYLPGNECAFEVVGFEPSAPPADEGTVAPVDDLTGEPPAGFRSPAAPPPTEPVVTDPPATEPPPTTTVAPTITVPETTQPPEPTTTPPPKPILAPSQTGTTIAPNVLDPLAPLPSVPLDAVVRACG
jgi:hypothetical protein